MRLLRFRHGERIATGVTESGRGRRPRVAGHVLRGPAAHRRGAAVRGRPSARARAALQARLRGQELRRPCRGVRDGRARGTVAVPEAVHRGDRPAGPDPAPAGQPPGRLRGRAGRGDRPPGAEHPGRGCLPRDPGLHVRERRDPARPAEDRRPVGARQGLRRVVPARSVDRNRARSQRRHRADAAQRRRPPARVHHRHGVRGRDADRIRHLVHDLASGRRPAHRHARGRRQARRR